MNRSPSPPHFRATLVAAWKPKPFETPEGFTFRGSFPGAFWDAVRKCWTKDKSPKSP